MDKKRTFLSINRSDQWDKGLLVDLTRIGDAVVLQPEKSMFAGAFYAASFDAGESDFHWGRVMLQGELGDALIRCSVHAQNTRFWDEEMPDIDAYLTDPYINRSVKTSKLDAIFERTQANADDFLANVKGRYLWVKVEIISQGCKACTLSGIRVQYSGDHMMDYLPDLYQREDEDGFTRRFLSIFNDIVLDMEERIYDIGRELDFETCSPEMKRYLASWLCIDEELEPAQMTERIRTAFAEYQYMQTPAGIARAIERWTGAKPIILEHFTVDAQLRRGKDQELYHKLFGENPYRYFVLLPERIFSGENRAELFLKRLRSITPAHVEAELVLLKEGVYLDYNTYMGINTQIADYKTVSIADAASFDYNTIIGGKQDEDGGKA